MRNWYTLKDCVGTLAMCALAAIVMMAANTAPVPEESSIINVTTDVQGTNWVTLPTVTCNRIIANTAYKPTATTVGTVDLEFYRINGSNTNTFVLPAGSAVTLRAVKSASEYAVRRVDQATNQCNLKFLVEYGGQ